MTSNTQLFGISHVNVNLREVMMRSDTRTISEISRINPAAPVLAAMTGASDEWDNACQHTIIQYGASFVLALNEVLGEVKKDSVDVFLAYIYLFLIEAELSLPGKFSDQFIPIKEQIAAQLHGRSDRPGIIVNYAAKQLPIQILKSLINSPFLGSLKQIGSAASDAQAKIDQWQQQLSTHEETVKKLDSTLEKQKDAYNFVLLNKGFSELKDTTVREISRLRRYLLGFGLLMLLPASIDLYIIAKKIVDLDVAKTSTLIAGSVISVTSTLIFLYFFRIVLREVDSKEAQLMQVRLRMTLCQFIQNYADFASDLKAKNVDALSKFETLIFSGIVGTQDKLPSTFDGIEQIGALIKSARSEK